jgi:hypothetical protein
VSPPTTSGGCPYGEREEETKMTRERVHSELQDIVRSAVADECLVLTPRMTARDIARWDFTKQVVIAIAAERAFSVCLHSRVINEVDTIDQMIDHIIAAMDKSRGCLVCATPTG